MPFDSGKHGVSILTMCVAPSLMLRHESPESLHSLWPRGERGQVSPWLDNLSAHLLPTLSLRTLVSARTVGCPIHVLQALFRTCTAGHVCLQMHESWHVRFKTILRPAYVRTLRNIAQLPRPPISCVWYDASLANSNARRHRSARVGWFYDTILRSPLDVSHLSAVRSATFGQTGMHNAHYV